MCTESNCAPLLQLQGLNSPLTGAAVESSSQAWLPHSCCPGEGMGTGTRHVGWDKHLEPLIGCADIHIPFHHFQKAEMGRGLGTSLLGAEGTEQTHPTFPNNVPCPQQSSCCSSSSGKGPCLQMSVASWEQSTWTIPHWQKEMKPQQIQLSAS